jgi:hypothetical protein
VVEHLFDPVFRRDKLREGQYILSNESRVVSSVVERLFDPVIRRDRLRVGHMRALSSAVEHLFDVERVRGSSPLVPTIKN